MDITNEIKEIIKQPEGLTIEYKSVLPPSRSIAQLICAFANAEGGYIVLGVTEERDGKIKVNGLSEDFHASSITHKALDLLSEKPDVYYQYVTLDDKKVYVIKITKSNTTINVEGKIYKRVDSSNILSNPIKIDFKSNGYIEIENINNLLKTYLTSATVAKTKLIEHYQSILKIIDDLNQILYPAGPTAPTDIQEGKVLSRILFSSAVDNFETYLSGLLYEIYLANPSTLKSAEQVSLPPPLKFNY